MLIQEFYVSKFAKGLLDAMHVFISHHQESQDLFPPIYKCKLFILFI